MPASLQMAVTPIPRQRATLDLGLHAGLAIRLIRYNRHFIAQPVDQGIECLPRGRRFELSLQRAVVVENDPTFHRKPRAAAAAASRCCLDEPIGPAMIEGVHQQPRPSIAHAKCAAGAGNRPLLLDRRHQIRLARSYCRFGTTQYLKLYPDLCILHRPTRLSSYRRSRRGRIAYLEGHRTSGNRFLCDARRDNFTT